MNLDFVAGLALVALVSLAGLALWRLLGGRPRRLRRRVARLVVVLLAATVLVAFGAYRLMNARAFQLFGREVARVKIADKVVALTFDDGPAAAYVDVVLADLDEYDARGTFFVIGAAAKDHGEALRKLVAAGEEIGNHSYTHPRLVFVSTDTVAAEVEATDRVIRTAGHRGPILFRPPYSKRLVSVPYYLWRHDRTTVMWDLEPDSIAQIADEPQAMASYVADNVRPGSIVLLHVWDPSRTASRVALPLILEALTAKGFRVVTVSELLKKS